jgi:hypothetical protein
MIIHLNILSDLMPQMFVPNVLSHPTSWAESAIHVFFCVSDKTLRLHRIGSHEMIVGRMP